MDKKDSWDLNLITFLVSVCCHNMLYTLERHVPLIRFKVCNFIGASFQATFFTCYTTAERNLYMLKLSFVSRVGLIRE